jgi:hypothetical protein
MPAGDPAMNGKAAYTIVPPAPNVRAVQDEWGMFDPNQAGLKAAFRAVRALSTPIDDSVVEPVSNRDSVDELPVSDAVPPPAVHAAAPEEEDGFEEILLEPALLESRPAARTPANPRVVSHAVPQDENVYDLTEAEPPRRRPKQPDRGAIYTLEFPTTCPQCCTEISTVRVSRLLRTQVSFTSTLPRKGYIIVCPECSGILSAELSGLI